MLRRALFAALALFAAAPAYAQSGKTLKVVMQSDLKIVDPVWTTAYIVRNHGYLIYDTLFALDGKLEPRPQMVESWTVSDDQLTWTFKLREGLKWHDGQPVTTADVLPSIKRFTDKDTLGGLLGKQTQEMTAIDDRTFQIVPARRSSICAIRTTSRAPSRLRVSPAARWPRSTGSNGSPSPTRRPRSTPCSRARST